MLDASAQGSSAKPVDRELIRSWERLRLLYNVMVVATGMVSAFYSTQLPWLPGEGLLFCLGSLMGANMFFMAGPGLEALFRLPSWRARWLRVASFLFVTSSGMWYAWFMIVLSGPLADGD
jgi:hypothetical protein